MQKDGEGCIYEYEVKVSGGFSGRSEVLSLADLMFILLPDSLVCVTPRIRKPRIVRYSVRKPQALACASHHFVHNI